MVTPVSPFTPFKIRALVLVVGGSIITPPANVGTVIVLLPELRLITCGCCGELAFCTGFGVFVMVPLTKAPLSLIVRVTVVVPKPPLPVPTCVVVAISPLLPARTQLR